MKERLRQRFRKEYLGQLVLATKKKVRQLQPREIVLLGVEYSKRLEWPLAVVEELIPGRDGEVRLVKLRTASGVLLRPIQRLYPLEIYEEELPISDQTSVGVTQEAEAPAGSIGQKDNGLKGTGVRTRSGRKIKLSSRFRM